MGVEIDMKWIIYAVANASCYYTINDISSMKFLILFVYLTLSLSAVIPIDDGGKMSQKFIKMLQMIKIHYPIEIQG